MSFVKIEAFNEKSVQTETVLVPVGQIDNIKPFSAENDKRGGGFGGDSAFDRVGVYKWRENAKSVLTTASGSTFYMPQTIEQIENVIGHHFQGSVSLAVKENTAEPVSPVTDRKPDPILDEARARAERARGRDAKADARAAEIQEEEARARGAFRRPSNAFNRPSPV
jgi:hypothetical protein